MMNKNQASYQHWLREKLTPELQEQTQRLRSAKDVKHVRLMADAHLANDVCVGCVLATQQLIYPAAIGGDIGCGMLSVPLNIDADFIQRQQADMILKNLTHLVPIMKQTEPIAFEFDRKLSNERLQHIAQRDGCYQLGTLGRGNHFLELQRCLDTGQLWLMIHTGSRGMGPTIRDYHLHYATGKSAGLKYFDINSEQGLAYFNDLCWAREYANTNRLRILQQCRKLFHDLLSISVDESQMIHCDHNHLDKVTIHKQNLLIHRKGACSVAKGEASIIPGSMGSDSFHVIGKGNVDALFSSSHGAGRCMSRQQARKTITSDNLSKQLSGIFYQQEKLRLLTEEAPTSYKNIEKVMSLQKKLVKVKRRLSPVLSYKGT